jgi:hypothetical protein
MNPKGQSSIYFWNCQLKSNSSWRVKSWAETILKFRSMCLSKKSIAAKMLNYNLYFVQSYSKHNLSLCALRFVKILTILNMRKLWLGFTVYVKEFFLQGCPWVGVPSVFKNETSLARSLLCTETGTSKAQMLDTSLHSLYQ